MEFWTFPNRLIFSNVQIGSSNGPNADSYLYWSSLNDMGRPSSSKLLKFSRNWFILGKTLFSPPTQYLPSQILTSYQIVVLAWREFFSCRIVAVEEIAKHLLHFSYLGQLHQLQRISRLRNWRWLRNSHKSHLPKQLRAEMIHYDIDMSHTRYYMWQVLYVTYMKLLRNKWGNM